MKTFDYALLEEMYAAVCKERDSLRAELVRVTSYNEMQTMLLDNMQAELDAPKASVPEKLPVDGTYGKNHHYAEGWNDCIDALTTGDPK